MSRNQAKQTTTEENDVWISEDSVDLGEASNDAEMPIKERMIMRNKIEELLEKRRLDAQLGDYEVFDIDEASPKTRRMH